MVTYYDYGNYANKRSYTNKILEHNYPKPPLDDLQKHVDKKSGRKKNKQKNKTKNKKNPEKYEKEK